MCKYFFSFLSCHGISMKDFQRKQKLTKGCLAENTIEAGAAEIVRRAIAAASVFVLPLCASALGGDRTRTLQ